MGVFKRAFQNQFGIKVEMLNLCVKTTGYINPMHQITASAVRVTSVSMVIP